MLVQFSVENFKSFNELTTWSLRATADARLPHHVVTNPKGKGGAQIGVLRAAAIYGANAAGKSNLVLAMSFAQRLILNGTRGEERLSVQPFKLGDGKEKPSRFEFIFRHNDVLYSYGFAATARRVHEEWLFATYKTKETRLFERVTNGDNKTVAEYGATLKRSAGGGFLDFVAQGTRPNQLLLTECYERDVDAVKSVREWFDEVLTIIRADAEWSGWPRAICLNEEVCEFTGSFLNAAGTGIEKVVGIESSFLPEEALVNTPEPHLSIILDGLESLEAEESLPLIDKTGNQTYVRKSPDGHFQLVTFTTQRRNANGDTISFRLEEESEGTQRLFHLVPALFSLKNHPRVFIIDELDRRLHPLLTRLFVQAALDCGNDEPQGQLLFTTHDTNLLDLDLLRRDEIWFVEKDANGATHLASLAEWKVRPDLEIEKGYLNGRFGAIPFFGDVSKLLCEPEVDSSEVEAIKHAARRQNAKSPVAATTTRTNKVARPATATK